MSAELRGGYVTDMWVHIILGVGPTAVSAFVDGLAIRWDQFGFSERGRDPITNFAYPDPTAFHGDNRLGSFTMTAAVPHRYDGQGADYLGCYTDSADREFPDDAMRSSNRTLTPWGCAQTCVRYRHGSSHIAFCRLAPSSSRAD